MADHPLPERPLPPPTWRDVLDRVVPAERAGVLRLVAVVVGLVLTGAVGWWLLRPPPAPATELSLPFAGGATSSTVAGAAGGGAAPVATATTAPADLVVHAAGAVAAPGVHRVPAGSRVSDVLAAAGGPAADADLDRVNLAAPVADGERVWFPRIGEPAPPPASGSASGSGSPSASSPPEPIDLNRATAEELEALPGVGPSIAAAIVEHRERSGDFRSVDDLLDVPGIGPARLDQLRDLVTV